MIFFNYNDTVDPHLHKVNEAVRRTQRRVGHPFTNTIVHDDHGGWVWWTNPDQEAVFREELEKSGVRFEEKDEGPQSFRGSL